ncbi:MAG: outer membrane protein transport protein [gamma proteobacterium symbiont of Taylorina sp.]|nr:outer membrane protein transport protein [gamma proteobacterium symbiont of Taylorina sp.]
MLSNIFCIIILYISYTNISYASGFSIPGGLSIAGLGTADTLVANPVESGAFAYNPAAMSFHEGSIISLGLEAVYPNSSVTPEGETKLISDNVDSPLFVPNLYLMSSVADNWSLGLAVNSPFGLETNWMEGTFSGFAGALAPFHPTKTGLEMFNVNPNISYKINKHFSFATGIDYYRVMETTSDTQGFSLGGDGDGLGWNIALMSVYNQWSFGFSYQSTVKTNINGEFDATQILGFKVNSETIIEFPDILRLGVRYQVNDQFAIEFDFDQTGWSSFDEIVVKSRDSLLVAGISSGSVLAKTTNNWNDTNSYHLGATYQLISNLQLRFGYTLNQNPQPEQNFTPQYPNSRRHLFTIGFKHENKGWDLEGGIMYAKWEDRTINNSKPFTGGDANGTSIYNGKYELDGILAGVGINFHF